MAEELLKRIPTVDRLLEWPDMTPCCAPSILTGSPRLHGDERRALDPWTRRDHDISALAASLREAVLALTRKER